MTQPENQAEAPTDYIAEAITEAFGERCPDFAEGCACCEAWKQYDELRAALPVQPEPADYAHFASLQSSPPVKAAAHLGDPCIFCGVAHDEVEAGPCKGQSDQNIIPWQCTCCYTVFSHTTDDASCPTCKAAGQYTYPLDYYPKRLIAHAASPVKAVVVDICASEGCGKPAAVHFIRGDVGSYYCADCYGRIHAAETERLVALASQNAVEGEAVGVVEAMTGSLDDISIIRWVGAVPPVGTKLYARPAAAEAGVREALDSCICLLETMAETAKERGDTAEWSMMSVMAENGRATLSLAAKRGQAE